MAIEAISQGSTRTTPPARSVSYASTTSSSSVGGSLNSAAHRRESIVVGMGQNAISMLLQPPITRTGLLPQSAIYPTLQKVPTFRDIPPVALAPVRQVNPSVFENYIDRVGSLFDVVQNAKLESEDSSAQVFRQDILTAKGDELGLYGSRKTSFSERSQHAPTPLSTIPPVYFNQNFRLENPRIFDVVSEYAEIVRQPSFTTKDGGTGFSGTSTNGNPRPIRKALTTNAMLQEKLSWYMDTVEAHLISSISQMSDRFFAALESFRELQAEAADSVGKIQKLRQDLAHLDQKMAVAGLDVIIMKRRRNDLRQLADGTQQLQFVLSGVAYCEELLDSGQLERVIPHISYVEQLVSGTLDPKTGAKLPWILPNTFIGHTDLRRLHAIGELLQSINRLRMRVGNGYEARLLNVLLCDLRRHVSSVPPRETLARWADATKRARDMTEVSSLPPLYMMTAEKLRADLNPVLQGLGQSQYLAVASTTFREAVIREMKSLIRQHLPSSTEDDSDSIVSTSTWANGRRRTQQEKSGILSRDLRALSPKDADALIIKVYCGIGEALRRLGVQVKLLLDITSSMHNTPDDVLSSVQDPGSVGNPTAHLPNPLIGPDSQEGITQALDLSSLLEQAVDKAQSEMTKVLRVRTEQTIHLTLNDFLSYFTLNHLFVNECEAVSGHSTAALNGVLNKQIHDFVPLLHEMEKQKLAQRMESEKWERIDLEPHDAVTLKHIVQSMTTDPQAWLDYTAVSSTGLEVVNQDLHKGGSFTEPTNSIKQDKTGPILAVIEDEKFTLVDSAAFALRGIEQYMILLVSIPSMASGISTNLLDYLQLYNSRTQQLILGAGAKLTAGLTNINTKHLALASQSLSLFAALIPFLQECVRRRPSFAGSDMSKYDRLKRVFQDHQSSIHNKLIYIMSSRAAVCIRAIEKVKWDDEDEVQRNVSPQTETLTKEALTPYRGLTKYLPTLEVRMIVGRVFISYKEQWSKAFEGAAIRTEAGHARLLRDAELLKVKLDKIDGAEELGAHMVSIVKAKQVATGSKPGISVSSGEGAPTPFVRLTKQLRMTATRKTSVTPQSGALT